MRTIHLPEILKKMPTDVQQGIQEVQKLASAGNQSSTIQTTNDKLFLLSEIEVFGSAANSFAGEGTQYAYYQAGNSKVKNRVGSAVAWWERSPYKRDTGAFCFVNTTGGIGAAGANNSNGVAFAFCF